MERGSTPQSDPAVAIEAIEAIKQLALSEATGMSRVEATAAIEALAASAPGAKGAAVEAITTLGNAGKKSLDGAGEPAIRIRMYNVGFGDCFLLFLPIPSTFDRPHSWSASGDEGPSKFQAKILIDCGSFKKQAKSITEIVGRLIEDLREEDGIPRVDIIVATHRHKDHISGFADPRWSQVHVNQVWLPWTEDDHDAVALHLRARQAALGTALQRIAAISGNDDVLALNASRNDEAIDTLKQGFAGQPTRYYLPSADAKTLLHPFEGSGWARGRLQGISIYVLGPSRNPDVILEMTPPDAQSYFALLETRADTLERPHQGSVPEPFGMDWVAGKGKRHLDQDTISRLERVHDGVEISLARSLDNAINNTSLMLVFVIGQTHLLFPGDAQWGPWREILKDSDATRLLSKTTFYKVGHHGSHNATPVSFVEKCLRPDTPALCAMVPVTAYKRWPEIPREPLLDQIKARFKTFVRSDVKNATDGLTRDGDWFVEATIPVL